MLEFSQCGIFKDIFFIVFNVNYNFNFFSLNRSIFENVFFFLQRLVVVFFLKNNFLYLFYIFFYVYTIIFYT